MVGMDRVALVALLWFAFWTSAGDAIGYWFKTPGTGLVLGFIFALITVVSWPWVLPEALDDWMHNQGA